MTGAIRILAVSLITAALVIAVELTLTLAWAEPLTNLQGWLAQRDAETELEELQSEFGTDDAAGFDPAAVPEQAARLAERAVLGNAIGRIEVPEIDLNLVVVEGTDTASLEKGPGRYPAQALPGQPGTTAIAGHRTTYGAPFRSVNRLDSGETIRVEMPYGTFTYEVTEQRIVLPSDTEVLDAVGYPQLVLTSCHPPYSAAERIVIFARLVETGPPPGQESAAAGPNEDVPEAQPEIGGPSLGPSLAGIGGLGLIAALVWVLSGRLAPTRPGAPGTPRR